MGNIKKLNSYTIGIILICHEVIFSCHYKHKHLKCLQILEETFAACHNMLKKNILYNAGTRYLLSEHKKPIFRHMLR